jgi:hypothetical protein
VADKEESLHCTFCSRSHEEVDKLIAGPSVFICDQCVDVCVNVLIEDDSSWLPSAVAREDIDLEKLGLKPPFKTLRFELKKNHCFHLCPFQEPFDTIYRDHLIPTTKKCGFTIERADEIFSTGPIVEDIWQAIVSATIITADVTGRNPNVMYEIGMAHTVGKPVVILTQDMNDVPFDLRHYRCIVYSYTPRGCSALESQLLGTLRFLHSKIQKSR